MYRVVLALGLLITPAAAIEYTQKECDALVRVFGLCPDVVIAKNGNRKACGQVYGFVGGPDFTGLREKYPNEWGDINCRENEGGKTLCEDGPAWKPLRELCQQLCDQKIKQSEALAPYCPRQAHDAETRRR